MKRKSLISLAIIFIFSGLLFVVSCEKQPIESTKPMVDKQAEEEAARLAAEKAKMEEMERQKALEEERLREEELMRAEAVKAEKEAEKNRFMAEDIYFDFDRSTLRPDAQQVLQEKAAWLLKNPDVAVIIEGHCDERGTNEYNLALGDRRAESARTFLIDLGIESSRLTPISYGEERPVDPGKNEEAWAKNRRVHFVVE